MSTSVRVIHPNDFVRARADGRVDLEMGKTLLAGLASASARLEQYAFLIDMRDSIGRFTPEELHELAGSLAEFHGTFTHRSAVLCPRERFDNARFFSLLAASHGFRSIRAFLTYEDAMEWLIGPDTD